MKTRRELLKYFGIGTIIAPVVAGVVQPVEAKLIEVPNVSLVKAPEIVRGVIDMSRVESIDVIFKMQDGASIKGTVPTVWHRDGVISRGLTSGLSLQVYLEVEGGSPPSFKTTAKLYGELNI